MGSDLNQVSEATRAKNRVLKTKGKRLIEEFYENFLCGLNDVHVGWKHMNPAQRKIVFQVVKDTFKEDYVDKEDGGGADDGWSHNKFYTYVSTIMNCLTYNVPLSIAEQAKPQELLQAQEYVNSALKDTEGTAEEKMVAAYQYVKEQKIKDQVLRKAEAERRYIEKRRAEKENAERAAAEKAAAEKAAAEKAAAEKAAAEKAAAEKTAPVVQEPEGEKTTPVAQEPGVPLAPILGTDVEHSPRPAPTTSQTPSPSPTPTGVPLSPRQLLYRFFVGVVQLVGQDGLRRLMRDSDDPLFKLGYRMYFDAKESLAEFTDEERGAAAVG